MKIDIYNLIKNSLMIDYILFILLIFIFFLIVCIFLIHDIMYIIILTLLIFITTGIVFILLEFSYLGFMFLIIYAGAIVILFIFVLMLISLKRSKNILNFNGFKYFLIYLIFSIYFIYLINYSEDILNLLNNKIIFIKLNCISILHIKYLIFIDYILELYFYHKLVNLIELSILSQYSIILFQELWFETLFIGLILLFALLYIIYFFKK